MSQNRYGRCNVDITKCKVWLSFRDRVSWIRSRSHPAGGCEYLWKADAGVSTLLVEPGFPLYLCGAVSVVGMDRDDTTRARVDPPLGTAPY